MSTHNICFCREIRKKYYKDTSSYLKLCLREGDFSFPSDRCLCISGFIYGVGFVIIFSSSFRLLIPQEGCASWVSSHIFFHSVVCIMVMRVCRYYVTQQKFKNANSLKG